MEDSFYCEDVLTWLISQHTTTIPDLPHRAKNQMLASRLSTLWVLKFPRKLENTVVNQKWSNRVLHWNKGMRPLLYFIIPTSVKTEITDETWRKYFCPGFKNYAPHEQFINRGGYHRESIPPGSICQITVTQCIVTDTADLLVTMATSKLLNYVILR